MNQRLLSVGDIQAGRLFESIAIAKRKLHMVPVSTFSSQNRIRYDAGVIGTATWSKEKLLKGEIE